MGRARDERRERGTSQAFGHSRKMTQTVVGAVALDHRHVLVPIFHLETEAVDEEREAVLKVV